MSQKDWLNEAAKALYSNMGTYTGKRWLCVHEGHLVRRSEACICRASLKIMEFTHRELYYGMSSRRWNHLAAKLRLLAEEGVL